MDAVDGKRFESREEILASLKENRDLSGADMSGLHLSGMKFTGLKMAGADLHDAILDHAVLAGADMSEVNLSNANLADARIGGANLHGANLRGANLHAAKMGGIDLKEADLSGADLSGSRMVGVGVSGADFTDVLTVDASAAGVSWSEAKVQPDVLPATIKPPRWLFLPVVSIFVGLVLALILVRRAMRSGECECADTGAEEGGLNGSHGADATKPAGPETSNTL